MSQQQEEQKQIPELFETSKIPTDEKKIHQVWSMPSDIPDTKYIWLVVEIDTYGKIGYGYHSHDNNTTVGWGYLDMDGLKKNEMMIDTEVQSFKEMRQKFNLKWASEDMVEARD